MNNTISQLFPLYIFSDDLLLDFERLLQVFRTHNELLNLCEVHYICIHCDSFGTCWALFRGALNREIFRRGVPWCWVSGPWLAYRAANTSTEQVLVWVFEIGWKTHIHRLKEFGINRDRRATLVIRKLNSNHLRWRVVVLVWTNTTVNEVNSTRDNRLVTPLKVDWSLADHEWRVTIVFGLDGSAITIHEQILRSKAFVCSIKRVASLVLHPIDSLSKCSWKVGL